MYGCNHSSAPLPHCHRQPRLTRSMIIFRRGVYIGSLYFIFSADIFAILMPTTPLTIPTHLSHIRLFSFSRDSRQMPFSFTCLIASIASSTAFQTLLYDSYYASPLHFLILRAIIRSIALLYFIFALNISRSTEDMLGIDYLKFYDFRMTSFHYFIFYRRRVTYMLPSIS